MLDKLDQTFTRYQIAHIGKPYSELLDEWTYKLPNGDFVLNWDLARYFNHSCDPSCMNAGMTFEITVRDIPPGAELTDDYRMLNKSLPYECACGSPQCHRRISADDFLHHAPRWDDIVRAAFPSIPDVEQPLWNLVKKSTRSRKLSPNLIEFHPAAPTIFSLSGNRLILEQQHTGGRNDHLTHSTQLSRRRVFCGAISRAADRDLALAIICFVFSPRARSPWRLRSCRTPISRHVRV